MPGIGFPQIDFVRVTILIFSLLIALTVHEASHALIATRLGDVTPRMAGRLTLNPIAHLDPLGTLMMIYTSIFGFGLGWAKPVPVNPYQLRTGPHTGMALVSAAGPLANLLTATVFAIALGAIVGAQGRGAAGTIYLNFVEAAMYVNVVIAIFNLIPIPPLDGFHVLLGVLPRASARLLAPLEQYGPFILLGVLFFGFGILGRILGFFANPIFDVLTEIAFAVSRVFGT